MSEPETIYLDDYRSLVTVSGGGWPQKAWVPKADYEKLYAEFRLAQSEMERLKQQPSPGICWCPFCDEPHSFARAPLDRSVRRS